MELNVGSLLRGVHGKLLDSSTSSLLTICFLPGVSGPADAWLVCSSIIGGCLICDVDFWKLFAFCVLSLFIKTQVSRIN